MRTRPNRSSRRSRTCGPAARGSSRSPSPLGRRRSRRHRNELSTPTSTRELLMVEVDARDDFDGDDGCRRDVDDDHPNAAFDGDDPGTTVADGEADVDEGDGDETECVDRRRIEPPE